MVFSTTLNIKLVFIANRAYDHQSFQSKLNDIRHNLRLLQKMVKYVAITITSISVMRSDRTTIKHIIIIIYITITISNCLPIISKSDRSRMFIAIYLEITNFYEYQLINFAFVLMFVIIIIGFYRRDIDFKLIIFSNLLAIGSGSISGRCNRFVPQQVYKQTYIKSNREKFCPLFRSIYDIIGENRVQHLTCAYLFIFYSQSPLFTKSFK